MLSLKSAVARDADEFADLIRPSRSPLVVISSGRFEARVTHIDLGRIWTQHVEESLPRAWQVQMQGRRFGLAFCESPQSGRTWRGETVPANQPLAVMPDSEGWDQVDRDARWSSMSISAEDAADASIAVQGHAILGNDICSRRIPPQHIAHAKQLLAELRAVATAPHPIGNKAAVAESLEQHLLESFLQCFGTIERGNDSAAKRRHAKIIQKFQQLIERHAGEPLYIPQICKRIGVTERTLRACFLEQVGVNPKRFLFLRRMSLTRQALRRAEAGTSTVTDIATTYGFWELGRFSVQYKEIFGESPSTTLRRPAD